MGNFCSANRKFATLNPKLLFAFALAGASAWGGTFTWNGGASGAWNEPGNWSPNGTPTGGDVAVFDSNAEITDAFEIGAGTLTVSNATATVHFDGVISGEGGIYKGGAGALHLHSANTFTGTFVSQGTGYTPGGVKVFGSKGKATGNSGVVYCHDVAALGATGAKFDPTSQASNSPTNPSGGSLPVFTNCAGTVSIPIELSVDRNDSGVLVVAGNGDVTFAGKMNSRFRMRMHFNSPYKTVFEQTCVHGNYINFEMHNASAKVYVPNDKGSVSPCGNPSAELHFTAPSPGDSFNLFQSDCRVVFDCENAMPSYLAYWEWNSASSIIDLGGFEQTVTRINLPKYKEVNASSHGFTSATKASVHYVGAQIPSLSFRGTYYGAAGIEWDPQNAATTYVYSNTVSATTGDVSVKSGTFRLAHGAGFSALGSFSVADGARFEAERGCKLTAKAMTFGANAKLALDGEQLNAETMTVGSDALADGIYSALTHPDLFEGEGSVRVRQKGTAVAWKGAAGGLWSDGANWEGGVVPGAGSDAVLGAKAKVVVDASPAKIHQLTVQSGATLTFSNWTTCVEADYVDVESGGEITCAGAFTNELHKSRVWLKCGALTVLAGGKINASRKGWSGGIWDFDANKSIGNNGEGWGPGATPNATGKSAASHGGFGGVTSVEGIPGAIYDNPYAPVEPGSGGTRPMRWGSTSSDGSGGGAVRIEATGYVRVDGEITADGTPAAEAWLTSYNHDSAASGGSVWISCAYVEGNGLVSANGGDGGAPVRPGAVMLSNGSGFSDDERIDLAGGGGMVKIETADAAKQATAATAGLRFSAAPGYYPRADFGANTLGTHDRYNTHAEGGTVVVTDPALRTKLIGNGLSGRVLDVASFTHEGDFTWSWGHVSFPAEGFEFRVTGNLTFTSADVRFDLGDVCVTNTRFATRDVWGGRAVNKLVVGGNLTVTNGATLAVRAAETNGAARWGAEVTVGGALAVGAKSCVIAAGDPVNLAVPHFAVGSLDVQACGTFSADRRGGAGGWGSTTQNNLLGESHPSGFGNAEATKWNLRSSGGSHGGVGGLGINNKGEQDSLGAAGACYDDAWSPVRPGAGGNVNGYGDGGLGGGVVYVEATDGVVVDGTVSADGGMSGYLQRTSADKVGGGAGGTVFLRGKTISGGGRLSARGGDGGNAYDYGSGAGGGGRIALRTGLTEVPAGRETMVVRKANEAALTFAGTTDVGGGTNVVAKCVGESALHEETLGAAGTVRMSETKFAPGTAIIIR